MIKVLYTLSIGLLFAALVGLGIQAFYPSPNAPEYPTDSRAVGSTEQTEAQKQYDIDYKSYRNDVERYNRNVSIWILAIAVVTFVVSLGFLEKVAIIGDGLMFGGLLTLFYGLIRAFDAGDDRWRFIAVAVGLVAVVSLAYWKFIRHEQQKTVS